MKKYTDIEFIYKLKEYGYTYIDGEYKNQFSQLKCYDKDGYIVYVQFNKIENRKSKPVVFHPSNPYTIDNIKLYLFKHPECKCKYVFGEYNNAYSNLCFECECGNLFLSTFGNVKSLVKNQCDDCTGYHKNLDYHSVKSNLEEKGYFLQINEKEFTGVTTSNLICTDKDGYKYKVTYDSVMRNKKMETFAISNLFTIYNINVYLKKYTNDEYECISDSYRGAREPLEFRHKKCGRIFKNKWINVCRKRYLKKLGTNKTGAMCSFCEPTQLESTHALVLKQVWIHEHPDTEAEERSCINPNTNCSLPTDIVNHRLKIAIEVQSWFHDFEDQKVKDMIKKEYWVNRGYKFYAVDQRDYKGDEVTIMDSGTGGVKVKYNDTIGYMKCEYLMPYISTGDLLEVVEDFTVTIRKGTVLRAADNGYLGSRVTIHNGNVSIDDRFVQKVKNK